MAAILSRPQCVNKRVMAKRVSLNTIKELRTTSVQKHECQQHRYMSGLIAVNIQGSPLNPLKSGDAYMCQITNQKGWVLKMMVYTNMIISREWDTYITFPGSHNAVKVSIMNASWSIQPSWRGQSGLLLIEKYPSGP